MVMLTFFSQNQLMETISKIILSNLNVTTKSSNYVLNKIPRLHWTNIFLAFAFLFSKQRFFLFFLVISLEGWVFKTGTK